MRGPLFFVPGPGIFMRGPRRKISGVGFFLWRPHCFLNYPPSTLHPSPSTKSGATKSGATKKTLTRVSRARMSGKDTATFCVECFLLKLVTPPPTPPLQGRGAAAALPAAWDSVGTPLPCRGGVGGGVTNLLTRNLTYSHEIVWLLLSSHTRFAVEANGNYSARTAKAGFEKQNKTKENRIKQMWDADSRLRLCEGWFYFVFFGFILFLKAASGVPPSLTKTCSNRTVCAAEVA